MGCSVGVESKDEGASKPTDTPSSRRGSAKKKRTPKGKVKEGSGKSSNQKFDSVCVTPKPMSPRKGGEKEKKPKRSRSKETKKRKGKRNGDAGSNATADMEKSGSFVPSTPRQVGANDLPRRQFDWSLSNMLSSEKLGKIDRWMSSRLLDPTEPNMAPLQNPQHEPSPEKSHSHSKESAPGEPPKERGRSDSLQLRKVSVLELTAMMPGPDEVKSSINTVRVDNEEEREVLEEDK